MRARVFVTLKPSVFDPQGTTVTEALHSLGYDGVKDVRQGKYFELEIDTASADEARRLVAEAADKLLANPVIETYRIEIEDRGATTRSAMTSLSAKAGAVAEVSK
jgi:phosphoribosylformylglycinamidine synthase PurS subunit